MSDRIVIIGSTGANLASLGFALQRLGVAAPVTEDPERILAAERTILPGVGAAEDAMTRLRRAGLDRVIPQLRRPLLGICLGMQLLFERSQEDDAQCLGVVAGTVERLPGGAGLPVPEMGWNELEAPADCPLLRGVEAGEYAYFVHSYAAPVSEITIARSQYGVEFAAAVAHRNFFGTQFHPERSARVGARILENFLAL
ncbi:MAG TPA: imidazole glycerol phosphate synthase subunit HisH [Gammaproteobacteria bacterium]|nr:imidazole glycerol phosphate synthase subunit HisH [Gammaproteobacteria bacterium]